MRFLRWGLVLILLLMALVPGSTLAQSAPRVTGGSTGGAVCYARIGDWVIRNDYVDGVPAIVGEKNGAEMVLLAREMLWGFFPAGNAFLYYGPSATGKQKWQLRNPDQEEPAVMPFKLADSPIHADAEHIWYYAMGNGSRRTVYRVDHAGKSRKKLGTLDGTVIGMMEGGSVLAPFFARDYVRAWKDGKYEMLYESRENLLNAFLVGRDLWVKEASGYGPVRDGVVVSSFEGNPLAHDGSDAQTAVVVDPGEGAASYGVYLLDGDTRTIAKLGEVPPVTMPQIALTEDSVTVWDGKQSFTFEIPGAEWFADYWGFEDY